MRNRVNNFTTQIIVRVSHEMAMALADRALEQNATISAVVREALERDLRAPERRARRRAA